MRSIGFRFDTSNDVAGECRLRRGADAYSTEPCSYGALLRGPHDEDRSDDKSEEDQYDQHDPQLAPSEPTGADVTHWQ